MLPSTMTTGTAAALVTMAIVFSSTTTATIDLGDIDLAAIQAKHYAVPNKRIHLECQLRKALPLCPGPTYISSGYGESVCPTSRDHWHWSSWMGHHRYLHPHHHNLAKSSCVNIF